MGQDRERVFVEIDGVVYEDGEGECPVCGQPGRTCYSFDHCPYSDCNHPHPQNKNSPGSLLPPFPEDLGPVREINDGPVSVFLRVRAGGPFRRLLAFLGAPLFLALDALRANAARGPRVRPGPFPKTGRLLKTRHDALRAKLKGEGRLAGTVEDCAFALAAREPDGLRLTLFTPAGDVLTEIETAHDRLGLIRYPHLIRRTRTERIGSAADLLDWRLSEGIRRLLNQKNPPATDIQTPDIRIPGPAPESVGTLSAAASSLRALATKEPGSRGANALAALADTAERARRLTERFPDADRSLDPLTQYLLPHALDTGGVLTALGSLSHRGTPDSDLILALEDLAQRAEQTLEDALAAEAAAAVARGQVAVEVHDLINHHKTAAR